MKARIGVILALAEDGLEWVLRHPSVPVILLAMTYLLVGLLIGVQIGRSA